MDFYLIYQVKTSAQHPHHSPRSWGPGSECWSMAHPPPPSGGRACPGLDPGWLAQRAGGGNCPRSHIGPCQPRAPAAAVAQQFF